MPMFNIKEIIIKNIYRTDYLAPRLDSAVKQVIVDQIFSRTVLAGKETVRISHADLSKITGISTVTISKAMRELVKEGILVLVGEYKPKIPCEYRLNLEVPQDITPWLSVQRNPYDITRSISKNGDQEKEDDYELTAEGHAIINSIKESMTRTERELYRKKAREELLLEGKDLSEDSIERKITQILIRGFSDEKKRRYLKFND
ncbi:MAG: winged helix-turn-helix transcriptional regulator [Nitrospirae bacterium]|nr:MAG: winged helix-turn-helix transcriptional regulator [Nitrospirota bacterium]